MTGGSEVGLKKVRVLSNTEQNWCRALMGGTATTAIVLQMAKPPSQISLLYDVLGKLRQAHPALRYKLHYDPNTNDFSFLNSTATAPPTIQLHDVSATTRLLRSLTSQKGLQQQQQLSECQLILEHELNNNTWRDPKSFPSEGIDVLFASVYALSESKCMVVLRLHVSVCDRTTGEALLLELMELVVEAEGGRKIPASGINIKNDGEGEKAAEELVPSGMGKKTLWAHGVDMLGYSVNSLRLTNLKFNSTKTPRYSEVVRLQMNTHQTARLLAGCKSRGIKLCGVLAAAGLMAAHSTLDNKLLIKKKKYGVVTLIDIRCLVQPPLSSQHFGFYQLPLLNIHSVNGSENLWELASKTYGDFASYKKCNKHFSDLGDINFLMRRAIENPSVTASSSLRTSLISVFEEPVVDDTKEMKREIGVEEYLGCSSAHGIGPSLAFFDTIRDGQLDCTLVYPAPLHSRDQITQLLYLIKNILINAT
ncbi:hypothetical protein ACS0TY_016076 [Phlomoides rotata]